MKSTDFFPRALSKALIFALLAGVVLSSDPAMAKIYKYKDEHGKTHYTDDPSRIPLRYRNKGSMKKMREVAEPMSVSGGSDKSSSKENAKEAKGGGDGILSSQEEAMVNRSIQALRVGVALGERYKDTMPNFFAGQGAINAIQSGLPLKESLAAELEGTKVPELQSVLGFLKQSISVDKQTTSIGSGLTTRIAGIFSRLVSEGQQQATLIKQLEQALKTSEKKKAEAKKKKEEEAKKEAEEAEKAKKKAEEEAAKKKAEEAKKEKEKIKMMKQEEEETKRILDLES